MEDTHVAPSPSRPWLASLVFVAAAYLLTTPGTWLVTDQAECLQAARRLLTRGTLTLPDDGARRAPEVPWAPGEPGQPIRTRFHPLVCLSYVPLLAADRALGLADEADFGTLVHLQGVFFVLGGLLLLGTGVRAKGGSHAATALAVALAGLAWPLWLIARTGGAEPILALLFVAYVTLEPDAGVEESATRLATRAALLATLPWVHPPGAVAALALGGAAAAFERPRRAAWVLPASAAVSCACLVVAWYGLYHGNWLAGGYTRIGGERFFFRTPLLAGLGQELGALVAGAPALMLLVVAAATRPSREALLRLRLPLIVLATNALLFATLYRVEPERRLSVAVPCLAYALGRLWDRRRHAAWAATLLVAAQGLAGFRLFWREAGAYYLGSDGYFYPSVVYVRLWLAGERLTAGLAAGLLCALLILAGLRLLRSLRSPAG